MRSSGTLERNASILGFVQKSEEENSSSHKHEACYRKIALLWITVSRHIASYSFQDRYIIAAVTEFENS